MVSFSSSTPSDGLRGLESHTHHTHVKVSHRKLGYHTATKLQKASRATSVHAVPAAGLLTGHRPDVLRCDRMKASD
jgi:hypothetical protein